MSLVINWGWKKKCHFEYCLIERFKTNQYVYECDKNITLCQLKSYATIFFKGYTEIKTLSNKYRLHHSHSICSVLIYYVQCPKKWFKKNKRKQVVRWKSCIFLTMRNMQIWKSCFWSGLLTFSLLRLAYGVWYIRVGALAGVRCQTCGFLSIPLVWNLDITSLYWDLGWECIWG